MARPRDIGVVDLMIGFPYEDKRATFEYLRRNLKDEESRGFQFQAQYMFGETPDAADGEDPVAVTFAAMDRHGVAIGLFGLGERSIEAAARHPGRVYHAVEVDPTDVMGAVRRLREAHAEHDIRAASVFPSGLMPQIGIAEAAMYPVYATCVELDVACIVNAGIAGPRFPSGVQHVEHLDRVCYDFPDLRLVMRHGAEPWEALAVKLMLKWPNLHYMPSAFAPRYYPQAVIDYANTRGADKIIYAGYYPMGLTLDRIMAELDDLPLADHVWPRFLRDNAVRVFRLGGHDEADRGVA